LIRVSTNKSALDGKKFQLSICSFIRNMGVINSVFLDTTSCGAHNAATCADCPQGNGAGWCNGVCQWIDGQCQEKGL
jgi:hypothetical protein